MTRSPCNRIPPFISSGRPTPLAGGGPTAGAGVAAGGGPAGRPSSGAAVRPCAAFGGAWRACRAGRPQGGGGAQRAWPLPCQSSPLRRARVGVRFGGRARTAAPWPPLLLPGRCSRACVACLSPPLLAAVPAARGCPAGGATRRRPTFILPRGGGPPPAPLVGSVLVCSRSRSPRPLADESPPPGPPARG